MPSIFWFGEHYIQYGSNDAGDGQDEESQLIATGYIKYVADYNRADSTANGAAEDNGTKDDAV